MNYFNRAKLIRQFFLIGYLMIAHHINGQVVSIDQYINVFKIKNHVYFLASDDLQGRNTGEPGNAIAAEYISAHFRKIGLKYLPGKVDYYQDMEMSMAKPGQGQIKMLDQELKQNEGFLCLNGVREDFVAPAVFLGFGDTDSLYRMETVKDKVIVVWLGAENDRNLYKALGLSSTKRRWAQIARAKALIEVYNMNMPWGVLKNFLSQARLVSGSRDNTIFHGLVNFSENDHRSQIKEISNKQIEVNHTGMDTQPVVAQNIVGMINGTDSILKDQYILLSAHFDHVGVKKGTPAGQDSIYNGTRDNAIGTAAILAAAEYFNSHPTKRSIIFAAWNGEEKGLLGSKHFVENPLIPLHQIRFNLNIDNAGYNDTSLISVIGLERTGASQDIEKACQLVRLRVEGDPAPEQNLFDRSDNVNFANIGIPAPTFSLGFTSFDQEISRFYHQTADNPDSVDYSYLNRYWTAYILTAESLGNRTENPRWKQGDKYEPSAKTLYGSGY